MKTKVFYEWDIEQFDEYEDILDHNHSDDCPGIPTEPDLRLVLVQDVWLVDEDGPFDLVTRCWAYVEGDKLPEYFDDPTHKVPQKYHRLLAQREKLG